MPTSRPPGNAHLLNASVAKRMRELRLDVAGRLYAHALTRYNTLPRGMELAVHANNSLKAAEALLQVEQERRPDVGAAFQGVAQALVDRWDVLQALFASGASVDDPGFSQAALDMSRAMATMKELLT